MTSTLKISSNSAPLPSGHVDSLTFTVRDPQSFASLITTLEGMSDPLIKVIVDHCLNQRVTYLPEKKHKMWQNDDEDLDDELPDGCNDIVFLSMLFGGGLTPDIVKQLSDEQLFYYAPFLIQYDKRSRRSVMRTLQHTLNKRVMLGQLVYFLQKVTAFWPKAAVGAWRACSPLENTVEWLDKTLQIGSGKQKLKEGQIWTDLDLLDPLGAIRGPVTSVKLEKIYASNARPMLLQLNPGKSDSSMLIFKRGDDLRQDYAVQTMFFVLNRLWAQSPLLHKPFIHQYKVLPMGSQMGILEFVINCQPSGKFDWTIVNPNSSSGLTPSDRITLLSSMAGSYLACWVLGIRDRHQDNMLIKDGKIFLQIDFGFIFNDAPGFDAPIFSIPRAFRQNLSNDEWSFFLKLCGDAFAVLHQNSGLIINTCTAVTSDLPSVSGAQVRKYLVRSLMVGLSEKAAKHRIRGLITEGSTSTQKEMKYLMHGLAVKMNK